MPQLAQFPEEYIYNPWEAPKSLQEASGCIIGKDYPKPIVDHKTASKDNMRKMKLAYDQAKLVKEEESIAKPLKDSEMEEKVTLREHEEQIKAKNDMEKENKENN